MEYNPKVHFIPARKPNRDKRVGIYCRVSTKSTEQLLSLSAQMSALTRLIAATPQWLLVDTYIDVASSKTGSIRREFVRMLEDCKLKKLDIILTKSISRFGRDSVDVLDALRQLREVGVRVIFEQESLDTDNTDSELMISVVEAIAQAENESRSENIKWGIKQRAAQGTSKLYNRKCYGYVHDENGRLIIKEDEAQIVRYIFDLYLRGKSVIGIIKELERLDIKTPTGKNRWCKRTIDTMLSNEKYMGSVELFKSDEKVTHYLAKDNNPAIISVETFKSVQIEKARRSNIESGENGTQRKHTKFSSKKYK